MQTNETTQSEVPSCFITDEPHNFTPLSKRHVFCTKCGINVRYNKPGKDKK